MKNRVSRYAGFSLLIVASLLITDGFYIKAKALVAQHLLQRAWSQTVEQGIPVKPWPWADTWPVARLQVERLGVDCIVLEGDSGEVLAFGPGHISRSATPVAAGNCALVGHRDTDFNFLEDIEKGDVMVLQNKEGKTLNYQVVSTHIKDNRELFLEETVTPWLTLITCYPFHAVNPGGDKRFVVFAKEMKIDERGLARLSTVNQLL